MKVDQAKRLNALKVEHARHRRAVADLTADKPVWKEVAEGKYGYGESFNGKFRAALRNGEIFYTLKEAQVAIKRGRRPYHTLRHHRALGSRPPAPETLLPSDVITSLNQVA